MKNIITLFAITLMVLSAEAQDLSTYKYIIIPQQFSFQKEPNQYKVNNLTKFLFKKYGFDAFISGEMMPPDANANGCNTLTMAADAGGFLSTNLTYTLSDCRGAVVYTSPEGKSKIKQYEGAYNEVMREAMMGLEELGYTYSDDVIKIDANPALVDNPQVLPTNNTTQTPVATTDKTVIVSTVPHQNTETNESTADYQEVKKASVENAQKTSKTASETMKSPKIADLYSSVDGAYSLKKNSTGFDFYEGDTKIGEARKTSAGSYLVSTSEFVGIGNLNGDTFTVEREIKGVEGLIKMEFKAADQ